MQGAHCTNCFKKQSTWSRCNTFQVCVSHDQQFQFSLSEVKYINESEEAFDKISIANKMTVETNQQT